MSFAKKVIEDLKHMWGRYEEYREEFIRNFSDVIGYKISELMEPHQRDLYGFSTAGGCVRANYIRLQYPEHQELKYYDYHTFFLGHLIEVTAIASLRTVGYDVHSFQREVSIPPYMRSQIDGILSDGPNDYVLSVKSTSYKASVFSKGKNLRKGFAALPLEGILGNPSHYVQLQLEMYSLGIPKGFTSWLPRTSSRPTATTSGCSPWCGTRRRFPLTGHGSRTSCFHPCTPPTPLVHCPLRPGTWPLLSPRAISLGGSGWPLPRPTKEVIIRS
jgi:hypothetical protein